jgi:hypothetical protein
MADTRNVLGANASGEEPAICPLHVIDLRGELVFGRTPVIDDESACSHYLGDVPKRLSVSVHRSDDCAAGVAVQQNAIRIAALGDTPQRRARHWHPLQRM